MPRRMKQWRRTSTNLLRVAGSRCFTTISRGISGSSRRRPEYECWKHWAKSSIPWRKPIASLNYLLSSHVWQQDHNGFTHQDPGFLDHVISKKADIVRAHVTGEAITALCGKKWVPTRDPSRFPVCPTCKELKEQGYTLR